MPHLSKKSSKSSKSSKKSSKERRAGESRICPCGNAGVKRISALWSCQRCIDWGENTPGTDNTRAVCGVALKLKRGDL